MGIFRRKLNRAISRTAGEPTDNPLHGAFVDGTTLQNISDTGFHSWTLKRDGQVNMEPTEENYPEPWRAGRELARARYVERLKNVEPIPSDPNEIAIASGKEGIALNNALLIALRMGVDNGEIKPEEVDPATISACTLGFAQGLMRIFDQHLDA